MSEYNKGLGDGFTLGLANGGGGNVEVEPLSVSENGTYTAQEGKAYTPITVNVEEIFYHWATRTLEFVQTNQAVYFLREAFKNQNQLKYFSARNSETFYEYEFDHCANLVTVIGDKLSISGSIPGVFQYCTNFKTCIILHKTVQNFIGAYTFYNTKIGNGTGLIYVPDLDSDGNDLPAQYKVSTNWAAYVNQIKGFSEAPVYDDESTYTLGDVCKYNNRFYAYFNKSFATSTGNAPTGTNENNNYWEFVSEIVTAEE